MDSFDKYLLSNCFQISPLLCKSTVVKIKKFDIFAIACLDLTYHFFFNINQVWLDNIATGSVTLTKYWHIFFQRQRLTANCFFLIPLN